MENTRKIKTDDNNSLSPVERFETDCSSGLSEDQVRQRMGLDDCYLMSALAGLAVLNPDYIKNTLIGEDPNNANYVNVKLYDSHGQPEVVRVKKTEWRNDDRPPSARDRGRRNQPDSPG